MEIKLKHFVYISFVTLLLISCGDDEDKPELITLSDSIIEFDASEVNALIIGESTATKIIRFNIICFNF